MNMLAYIISGILFVIAAIHLAGGGVLLGVPIFGIPAVIGLFYGMGLKRSNSTLIFILGYIIFFGMYFRFGIKYNLNNIFTWEALGYAGLSIWMGTLYISNKKALQN